MMQKAACTALGSDLFAPLAADLVVPCFEPNTEHVASIAGTTLVCL